jgi:hypothetical protein
MGSEAFSLDSKTKKLIADAWQHLGFKVRPVGRKVWVRTDPHEQKVGLIWKPPKLASFYGELPHQVTVAATVLAAGPQATVKPGERVCFTRLYFAHWCQMDDSTYIGYVDSAQLSGYALD